MQELGLNLETRDKINKKIYRMGFEARPLLIILATILVLSTVFIGLMGFYGVILVVLMIGAFVYVKDYMQKEIEKGNLKPIDTYLENMVKPDSIYDDGALDMLKAKLDQKHEKVK